MTDAFSRLAAALEGRYRVERELGAGGMATVYLAEDLRHDRNVAIKVLKPELAAVIGGDRFLTEIKTTASLQHPHILPLFDSGEADGFLFYVMPFVDGESLRDRLDREKQLGVEDAVRITSAVASALHYAHERGVVHRDIKPANILIHADQPVVADFGIALAISAAGGGRRTETGMSVGTPHYMSPEQASADRDVNARSDIYSLGCVLYECLAGEPPHTGANAQAVLLRILTEEPRDIGAIRKSVPTHVRHALARALEKLPADRFESADAFRRALGDESYTYRPKSGPGAAESAGSGRSTTARPGRDRRIPVLVVANLLLLAALAWTLLRPRAPAGTATGAPPHRYTIPDADRALATVDVSNDGDVVYAALADGRQHLRIRRADDTMAIDVPNTTDASQAAISPDGNSVVFLVGTAGTGGLRKVDINTGTEVTLVPAGGGQLNTPTWSADGRILFSRVGAGVMAVPDVGGDVTVLSRDPFSAFPRILPDGRTLLFTRIDPGFRTSSVVMQDLATGDTATLVPEGGNAFWSPTGHILFGHPSGTIQALPFDLERRRATGPPVPVQDDVFHFGPLHFFGVSETGTLAYLSGSSSVSLDRMGFAWLGPDGDITEIPTEPTRRFEARLSPDGRRLVYIRDDDLYLYDLAAGTSARFTFGDTPVRFPIWSADGTRIAFASRRGGSGTFDIWARNVDGRSAAELLYGADRDEYPAQWLEDGTLLLVANDSGGGPADILMLRQEDGDPVVLLGGQASATQPAVSPDGNLMAYVLDEGDGRQIYVREFPGMGGPWQVSDAPVTNTNRWWPDGRSIVYQDALDGLFVRARLELDPTFRVIDRTKLTTERVGNMINDIHRDGRILFNRPIDLGSANNMSSLHPSLVVVANWFTELRARLRAGNR